MEAIITWPKVPTTEINTVLNMYLEKGTHELLRLEKRSAKFLSVGFATQKRGGKIHSSSRGFSEVIMA